MQATRFGCGSGVLVDVLDQRTPHNVGHLLAPVGRDALRRIPQLVVDSDGVLRGLCIAVQTAVVAIYLGPIGVGALLTACRGWVRH